MGLRAIAAAVLVLALAGCGDDDLTTMDRPPPHPRPSTSGYCDDMPGLGSDANVLMGTDWSGEDHDFGDTVTVLACVPAEEHGTLALQAEGTGISVTPGQVRLEDARNGLSEFRVTVDPGATGGLVVQMDGEGAQGGMPGPHVVTDDDGWHFERSPG